MMMKRTERAVLQILKEILNKKDVSLSADVDISALYEELRVHSLVALAYPKMKGYLTADSEIAGKWLEKFAQQTYHWARMMEAQKALTDLLQEKGHVHAILKGSANGVYFPSPQLRYSGDIDFLVRWEEFEEIYQLLLENGYQLVGGKNDTKHHVELRKNSVIFEMHKCPGGCRINDIPEDQEILQFFQEGLNSIKMVQCGKYTIPMFSNLQNAMVLLLHTAQHLQGGLGLRHILDWMMFAKEEVDDDLWFTQLESIAKKGKVYTLAKVMTKMCQKYLGMTQKITWCQDADDELCDMLMEYVFQQGDFGTKAGEKDAEVRVLTDVQKSGGFIRRFKDSSLYSMPIARKYKFLLPVAWIYQLFRYATRWIMREHPLRTFRQNRKTAKKRAKFFKELGINRD